MLALSGHVLHGLDRGAVQVLIVLARLYEEVGLDVGLHLLHRVNEVVVTPIHLQRGVKASVNCSTPVFLPMACSPRSPFAPWWCGGRRSRTAPETPALGRH